MINKKCGTCGKRHYSVTNKIGENSLGVWWNCECGSTLFSANLETAREMIERDQKVTSIFAVRESRTNRRGLAGEARPDYDFEAAAKVAAEMKEKYEKRRKEANEKVKQSYKLKHNKKK